MRDASLNTTFAIFSLPSPGRYVPDGPLDEASPRLRVDARRLRVSPTCGKGSDACVEPPPQPSITLTLLMDPDGAAAFPFGTLAIDILVVLFFIILGGIFVAAEIALISLHRRPFRQSQERLWLAPLPSRGAHA